MTKDATWQHVPSEDNPADLLFRGSSVETLRSSSLWWNGPSWIRQPEVRPSYSKEPEAELPELKTISVILMAVNTRDIIQIRRKLVHWKQPEF
ncbi:hypothetical protein X777_03219 [Ooceraea biroi]|uniref:Uncharacterized protein n=1 Tax=Ooceraea biroi TaxID=2015173 RepID=A0A026WL66_OOCBI|nr:hypothetical protein X777_03219 [Ooceraea biroi]